jgi:hypothetical protein
MIVVQMVKKFPASYGTRMFNTTQFLASNITASAANRMQAFKPKTGIVLVPDNLESPEAIKRFDID